MKDNGFNSEMCSDLLIFLCSSGKDWDSKRHLVIEIYLVPVILPGE